MPRRCCVPYCKSNYDSTLKNQNYSISVFKFPKDDNRKQAWIKAIRRAYFVPSSHSVVCKNHFHPDDIYLTHKVKQPDNSFKEQPMKRPRLKENAIPRIFPNMPTYFSKSKTTTCKDPEVIRTEILLCESIHKTNNMNMEYVIETKATELLDADIPIRNEVLLESSTNSHGDVVIKDEIEIEETILYDENISFEQEDFSDVRDFNIKEELEEESFPELRVVHKNEDITKRNDSFSQTNSDLNRNKNRTNSHGDVVIKDEIEIEETIFYDENISVKQEDFSNVKDFDIKEELEEESFPELRVVHKNEDISKRNDSFGQTNSDLNGNKNHTNSHGDVVIKGEIEIEEAILYDENISLKQEDFSNVKDFDIKEESFPELRVVHKNEDISKRNDSCSQTNSDLNGNKNECKFDGAKFGNNIIEYKLNDCDRTDTDLSYGTSNHKLNKHKCEHCDYTSNRSNDLKLHIMTIHLKFKEHKCEHCGYTSSGSNVLKAHIKAVHLKLKEFKCEHCDYTTSRSYNLKAHIKAVHLKLKEQKCEHCDYTSCQSSNLKRHIKKVHFKSEGTQI